MSFGTDEFDYLEESESKVEEVESLPKISIKVAPEIIEDAKEEISEEPAFESDSIIYIVKVTTNKESKAIELITDRVHKKSINIYSLVKPHGLRGFIILEAPSKEDAEEAVFNLPYVKGIIPKQVTYDEIRQMIEPRASDIKIEKNDIVEIISESFKNEKAKVLRVDKVKGEAVVSLLAAIVPIPVTIKLDNIRVIRREEEESINS